MRCIEQDAVVNASAERVFDIVANVSAYPDFVASCLRARAKKEEQNQLQAELTLRQGMSDEDYNVKLQLERPNNILMTFDVGPPMALEVKWTFEALDDDRCRLGLKASYEAGGFAKELMFKPMLQRVCTQLAEAVACEAERA
jgi:ribosome-associated toxin RatA of RatAB toxin-antitoxin module